MSTKSSTTADWNATKYLQFNDERTRPSRDLLARIPLTAPARVVDLGCGPGNSTAQLAAAYPSAHLTGLDSSPNMLVQARAALPNVTFDLADLTTYAPSATDPPVDLYFSNAVFQWLPGDARIPTLTRLLTALRPGAVFAFQVPANFDEPTHAAMRATAADGPWASVLRGENNPLRDPFPSPAEVYNALAPMCAAVDIWQTVYQHVLADHAAVVDWVSGTGLRPFVDPLDEEMRAGFMKAYRARIEEAYPPLVDGKVMLRYPRLFAVLVKA